MQEQAVAAAAKGKQLAQNMADLLRSISTVTSHVTATGLVTALTTIKAEHTAFLAWDQTGAIPQINGNDVAVINPAYEEPKIDQFSIEKDEEGNQVVENGELQYTSIKVNNPRYNADIPKYVFSSSTKLLLDANGELQGNSIDDMLTMLEVAAAFDTLVKADNAAILTKIESVVTV